MVYGKVVRVGWWDIWRGRRNDSRRCPVARAIKRVTGSDILVESSILDFEENSIYPYADWYVAGYPPTRLPHEVARWIVTFDSSKPVRPIEFTI